MHPRSETASTSRRRLRSTVGIVIPCFNQAQYLRRSLDSVLAQTYDDWSVVVVDDGSSDDTSQIVTQYAQAHAGRDISLVRTRNRGLAPARNTGISILNTRFILPLDADDWIEPVTLEQLVRRLDDVDEAMVAACSVQMFGGSTGQWHPQPHTFEELLARNAVPVCSLFRREGWERVGGYAENLFAYEDWEFWISLRRLGEVVHVPKSLFHYRVNPEGLAAAGRARDLELRAEIVLMHRDVYGSKAAALAESILGGYEPTDTELLNPVHGIFRMSQRGRKLARQA